MVQWLGIHLPAREMDSIDPWSRKIPHAEEQLSPSTTIREEPLLTTARGNPCSVMKTQHSQK